MGLSLAEAAVSGMTIAEQKQSLLKAGDTEGLIALNRQSYGGFTMMAKKDDADDDHDDDLDDEDDEDEDEDEDEEDEEDTKGKKQDPKDLRIQELSAEAKKRRLRGRRLAAEVQRLKEENARLQGKGKKKAEDDEDDDESESEEAKAIKKENAALKERLEKQTIRDEFRDFLDKPKQTIKFKDPKVAFRLLDLDDVEVDEDGEVDGLEDAIKQLAEEAPYLLVTDDEEDEDNEDEKPKRRTGQRTGGKRKKGEPDRAALVKKYNMQR